MQDIHALESIRRPGGTCSATSGGAGGELMMRGDQTTAARPEGFWWSHGVYSILGR